MMNRDEESEQIDRLFDEILGRRSNDPALQEIIRNSIEKQKVILEEDVLQFEELGEYDTKISVTTASAFSAASKYVGRTAVLNFANWNEPSPGGLSTCSQESILCKSSTLYPCISSEIPMEMFYGRHRKNPSFKANDDIIYTPDVCVTKSDVYPYDRLDEKDRFFVDVITCAAPNLMFEDVSDEWLYNVHLKRCRRILETAHANGCDNMILGAFGCGVFRNDPGVVARASKDALSGCKGWFRNVEFAIFSPKGISKNYNVFKDVLQGREPS